MNIEGLSKPAVLQALYANAQVLGMGRLAARTEALSFSEAEALLEINTFFDYLHGRVMKIDLGTDEVWTALYNRDNGENAAENIIAKMREAKTA